MSSKNLVVALVDDDEIFQLIASKLFELCAPQFEIKKFFNGDEILEHLKLNLTYTRAIPDIILLDINMPMMDGWMFMEEFARLKDQINKTVRIYMVSSSIDPKDVDRANLNPSIMEYVCKPITAALVKRITASHLVQ